MRFVSTMIVNLRTRFGLFSNNLIFLSATASFVLIIILFFTTLFKLKPGADPAILHYNVLIGPDIVKSGWFVYQLPLLAGLVFVYNLVLARKFYKFEPFAAYLLSLGAALVTVILFIAVLALASLP